MTMLWICADDGVAFSVGARWCPQCGSTRYRPQGDEDGPIYVIGEEGELAGESSPPDAVAETELDVGIDQPKRGSSK